MHSLRLAGRLIAGTPLAALLSTVASAQVDTIVPAVDVVPPSFVITPVLTPNPNERVPLAARIAFQTDEPTSVELTIKDGERSWQVLAEPELQTDHAVAVLGVRFDRTHRIRVIVRDAAGNESISSEDLVFVTPPFPDPTPPMHVMTSLPDQMEPGVTLMNLTIDRMHPSYLLAIDHEGEIIWYFKTDWFTGDVSRLRNGNLLFLHGRFGAVEMDLFGNVVTEWYANNIWPNRAPDNAVLVDTDTFHHEIYEMPENDPADFAVASTELRVYPNYPVDEGYPTMTQPFANVIVEKVVEFTRDGTIVRETHLADMLDPYRMCYGSLLDFWTTNYGITESEDWGHTNAVIYDPLDDSYVVSLRHQEAVVKVDRGAQELVWILGPHDRWRPDFHQYLLTPIGEDFVWNYHQHAPEWTPSGNLLLLDNGNQRSIPPDPGLSFRERWSRAVEFRIDEDTMTVETAWAFGTPSPPDQWFTATQGDADYQPQTGNVLVTDSDEAPVHPQGASWARLVEVTHTDPPQVVFEVHMRDEDFSNGSNPWVCYRSDRIPGLYPHQ